MSPGSQRTGDYLGHDEQAGPHSEAGARSPGDSQPSRAGFTALPRRYFAACALLFSPARFFLTTSLRGVCCAVRIEKKVYRLGNRFECEAGFVEGGGPVRLAEVWIQRRVYFNEKRRCDELVSVWESVIRSARRG